MSAENEALVRRYVEEVYDQRRLEVADEIFAADFTLHDPDLPGGAHGPEGIKRIVETFVDAFPDLQVTLDDELSVGDKVVARWRDITSMKLIGRSTDEKGAMKLVFATLFGCRRGRTGCRSHSWSASSSSYYVRARRARKEKRSSVLQDLTITRS